MQTYLKSRPAWIQLLLFIGMAFGIFLVFSFIGLPILSNLTGISLLDLQNVDNWDASKPGMILFIRGILVIQFLGLFLIPSFLFSYFSDPSPARYLGLRAPRKNIYWILGGIILLLAIPAVEYLGMLNQQMNLGEDTQKWMKSMEEDAARQIQFMLDKNTPGQLLLNLVFIAAFAGIGEELFFRGILQRLFIKIFKTAWLGIFVAALIFSAFHLQFFGFLPRLALGMILGAVYWYSGSLWTAIIAHFIYDAFIIVLMYFNPQLMQDTQQVMFSPISIWALVSVVLTCLVIWLMKKKSTSSVADIYENDRPPKDDLILD